MESDEAEGENLAELGDALSRCEMVDVERVQNQRTAGCCAINLSVPNRF